MVLTCLLLDTHLLSFFSQSAISDSRRCQQTQANYYYLPWTHASDLPRSLLCGLCRFPKTQPIMRHLPSLTANLHRQSLGLIHLITFSRSLFVKSSAAFPPKPASKSFSTTPFALDQIQQQSLKSQQSQQPHRQTKSDSANSTDQRSGPSHGPDLGNPSFSFLREASPLVRWTVIIAVSVIGTAETYTYGRWGWGKWKEWRKGNVEDGQQRQGVGGEGEG